MRHLSPECQQTICAPAVASPTDSAAFHHRDLSAKSHLYDFANVSQGDLVSGSLILRVCR